MRPRRFAVQFAGLVLALVFLVSCGGAAGTPTPTPPPPLEILKAATDVGQKITSVHFDLDAKEKVKAQGQTLDVSLKFVGDMAPPDRLKGTMEISYAGQNAKVDTVVIGNTAYVKDPTTGSWQTTTQEEIGLNPETLIGPKPEDFEDLKFVGSENLGGRPVYHISGKANLDLSVMQGIDVNTKGMQADYWIDQETSHVLKAKVAGQVSATVQGVDATVDIDMTMLLSDYDKAVTIEPPQ